MTADATRAAHPEIHDTDPEIYRTEPDLEPGPTRNGQVSEEDATICR
ncbi:MAG: hypothetical protein M3Z00_02810 [Actinomycetota bacterium]|nr:hypothetical protein [Actinomycetota bacterium]